ncbi:MAG: hypothetical protein OXD32_01945 [Endozoicomonadaceae bacterium]|nr:hypothetical protein [Endozoicomonadaceae bacterium]MCY4330286.1 hypothetical protein [Endozoicomonadaceae bacterium]
MNPLDTKILSTDVTSKMSNISSETNRVNELVKKVTDAFAEKSLFNEIDNVITQLKETKGKSDSLKVGNSSYQMLLTTETQTISIIPPEENMSPDDTTKYLADIIEVLENYKKEQQDKSSDVLEAKYKNALSELFTEKDITTESQQEQLREKIEEQTTIIIEFGIINSKKCIKNVTGQYQDTENNLFKYTSKYNKEELAYIEKNKKNNLDVNYVGFRPQTDDNNLNVNYVGFRPQTDDNESKIEDMNNTLQKILDETREVQKLVNQQNINKDKQLLANQSLHKITTQVNAQKDQLSALPTKDSSEQLTDAVKNMIDEIDTLNQAWLQELQYIEKICADGVVSGAKK